MSSSRSRRRGADSKALVLIDRTTGTNIGNMTTNGLGKAFDGITSATVASGNCSRVAGSTSAYVGKTLTGPKIFGQAIVYGSNDQGFIEFSNPSTTINIRGKNGAAPSGPTDGTIVGTITFTDTANESSGRTINSSDLVNTWDHLFAEITDGSFVTKNCAELVLYEWA